MYTVTYNSASGSDSLSVEESMAMIENLMIGVEYTVIVQAFGDLPGTISQSVAFTLQGVCVCVCVVCWCLHLNSSLSTSTCIHINTRKI